MLGGGFARVAGRGERVFPIPAKGRYHLLLLLPKSGVDTAACYKKYDEAPDEKRNDAETCASGLVSGDFQMLCRGVYNALGAPAAKLNGDVQTALDELAKFSPPHTRSRDRAARRSPCSRAKSCAAGRKKNTAANSARASRIR